MMIFNGFVLEFNNSKSNNNDVQEQYNQDIQKEDNSMKLWLLECK